MAQPLMLVVAGPPGSGKTTYFPVTASGVALCATIVRQGLRRRDQILGDLNEGTWGKVD